MRALDARVSRRAVLGLALLAAGCEAEPPPPPRAFPPLDFSYLLPLRLDVGDIQIARDYIASGMPPDISRLDPISPVAALRLMAEQRLRADGASGHAEFAIKDASLIQQGDIITGTFSVELDIIGEEGARRGFAQATVTRQLAGAPESDLPAALYQLTSTMMQQMNVEFEFQVRKHLAAFLLPSGATQAPVHSAPLSEPPEGAPSPLPSMSAPGGSPPVPLPPPS